MGGWFLREASWIGQEVSEEDCGQCETNLGRAQDSIDRSGSNIQL